MNTSPGATPSERLFNFAFADAPMQSLPSQPESEQDYAVPVVLDGIGKTRDQVQAFRYLAQSISSENGTADIDISDPAFDFVRSIKVWNVMHYSHHKRGRNEECREISNITLGTYGIQGDFHWSPISPGPVPNWVIPLRTCDPASSARAVGVEWTDYEGNHGHEVVNY